MKKILLLLILSNPIVLWAQNQSLSDTVIIKDPSSSHEYWLIHNSDGSLNSQGFISKGKKEGLWRKYEHKDGVISRMEEYSNGVLNGASLSIRHGAVVDSDATYLNNQLVERHTADTIIIKDPLNMGREYQIIHNPDSTIRSQGFLLNGKKDGAWRNYGNSKGKISKIEEYSNGVLNGASVTIPWTGTVSVDETFLNAKLEGIRTVMNSGRIQMIENYRDGKLNGNKKRYYENTRLLEDGNWKNGERMGSTKWYKNDGTIYLEYTYNNGVLQGTAKEYDEKGSLKRTGEFNKNNETGEWKEFQDSVVVKKIIYKDGQIVKEIPVKKK